ncbi:MAG TPA: hypothetical protein VM260_05720 [Pirellula sp.]|nr:hypothetical protein [Pirellula sp.]
MPTNAIKLFLGLGLLLLSTQGCGPSELPFTDNSKDSAAFALDMKTLVLNTTTHLKNSKDQAATLNGVVSALSALNASPTGEHLKTYQEIHSLASALMAECEKGQPTGLDAKLKAIADLAEKLPGDAKIEKGRNPD